MPELRPGQCATKGEQLRRRRGLLRLWCIASLLWCTLIALLGYADWREQQRAGPSFEAILRPEDRLPDLAAGGLYVPKFPESSVGRSEAGMTFWFYGAVVIAPPLAALLFGLLGRRAGAL